MDINALLQTALYAIITTGLPLLLGYGISYLKTKRSEKLQLIDNTYVRNTLEQATDIIFNVVDTVSQTYVDDLKKEGKFTPENQKEALNKALNQAKELLNQDAINLVVEKYNDLDTWIRYTIEAYIKATKK